MTDAIIVAMDTFSRGWIALLENLNCELCVSTTTVHVRRPDIHQYSWAKLTSFQFSQLPYPAK